MCTIRPASVSSVIVAAVLALATAFQPAASLGQAGPVEYRIDLSGAKQQLIKVQMTLRGVAAETTDVHLPVWRPGLYLILDQAGTVSEVRASAGGGQALDSLPVEKINKSSWRITTRDITDLTVSYSVWAGSLDNRTRHADDTHVFLSPSSVLFYAHEWRDQPCRVRLTAPPDPAWRVASGLESEAADPFLLKAANYDVLADSPIEVGSHDRTEFQVATPNGPVPHEIVVWTGLPADATGRSSDIRLAERYQKMPRDLAKIVETQTAVFGSLPYERYVFLIHAYPGGRGGTEHLNSTIMQVSPDVFREDDRYKRFLSLASHEIFHTWNVKRFRPKGLTPYDYQRENYTELLWIAEGTTTYYEDLILVRAGLIKPDEFFKTLAESIDNQRRRPGDRVQSVAESSFDAWTKYNRRTPDATNSQVSFYEKGALVSFLLDMDLRRRSDNVKSLDDLMRELYRRFPNPDVGYTTADVLQILSEIAGDFSEFFRTAIDGTGDLPYESALELAGLVYAAPAAETLDTPEKSETPGDPKSASKTKPFTGLTTSDAAGSVQVATVLAGSPAASGGVLPNDIIVAINGRRVRPADVEKFIDYHKAGDRLDLTLFRNDMLRSVELELAAQPAAKPKLSRVKSPSAGQTALYESWLGVAWPKQPKKAGEDPSPSATSGEGEPTPSPTPAAGGR